jgi:hypothetical protein
MWLLGVGAYLPAYLIAYAVLGLSWPVAWLIGFVMSVVALQLRVTLWRRRHPLISIEEYTALMVAEMRRTAPYN